ncbi:MAG: hypothetical protein ACE5HP_11705 [Gemmatimonadota bacterium]
MRKHHLTLLSTLGLAACAAAVQSGGRIVFADPEWRPPERVALLPVWLDVADPGVDPDKILGLVTDSLEASLESERPELVVLGPELLRRALDGSDGPSLGRIMTGFSGTGTLEPEVLRQLQEAVQVDHVLTTRLTYGAARSGLRNTSEDRNLRLRAVLWSVVDGRPAWSAESWAVRDAKFLNTHTGGIRRMAGTLARELVSRLPT